MTTDWTPTGYTFEAGNVVTMGAGTRPLTSPVAIVPVLSTGVGGVLCVLTESGCGNPKKVECTSGISMVPSAATVSISIVAS